MPINKNKTRLEISIHKNTLKTLEAVAQVNHITKSEVLEKFFWIVVKSVESNKEDKKCN